MRRGKTFILWWDHTKGKYFRCFSLKKRLIVFCVSLTNLIISSKCSSVFEKLPALKKKPHWYESLYDSWKQTYWCKPILQPWIQPVRISVRSFSRPHDFLFFFSSRFQEFLPRCLSPLDAQQSNIFRALGKKKSSSQTPRCWKHTVDWPFSTKKLNNNLKILIKFYGRCMGASENVVLNHEVPQSIF